MTEELYITLAGEGSATYTEKKSEFIGYACPCKTEEAALAFLARIRKKHADARHHVYAYQIKENNIMRYSDDGEPQGTAGMPVLDIIRKTGFTDAIIVVVRYFGGILLGTGGLVRAYSHAAKLAVEAARVVTYERFVEYELICDYADYEKIRFVYGDFAVLSDAVTFAQDVTQRIAVRASECDTLISTLTELTNGTVLIDKIGERFDFIS